MNADKQYRAEQFGRITTPREKPELQIYRPDLQLKTGWISISEKELQAIIELLT